ncbi:ATP-binding cassette domain-containing protein [Streptomyces sp. NPDC005811]|uniref:ATP-binding cassette domain-containing protein n=1 Tax=Streptomyces sp. NPDC005811 TaxID=3154565 RepID=UPI00340D090B
MRAVCAAETAPSLHPRLVHARGPRVPGGRHLAVDGLDLTPTADLREVRRKRGCLPQQFGFHPRFTVREFVAYMAWLREMPRTAIPDAVQRAIDRVGLTTRADAKMKTLSGGMLRRAGIAQAIVNDREQRLDFRDLLRDLGADSCAPVSTHLVEDDVAARTDVILMNEGPRVFRGTPDYSPAKRGYSAPLRQHRSNS